MSDLTATLRAEARGWRMVRPTDVRTATMLDEAADRIDELEIRCAEKDASIAQLIEQLQEAEAQLAAIEHSPIVVHEHAGVSVSHAHRSYGEWRELVRTLMTQNRTFREGDVKQ